MPVIPVFAEWPKLQRTQTIGKNCLWCGVFVVVGSVAAGESLMLCVVGLLWGRAKRSVV